MEKKKNIYKVNFEMIQKRNGDDNLPAPIEIEFDNHDDIFDIIEKIKEKNLFADKAHDLEFAIGLKMFSEVLLKNKKIPLFEEFGPAFSEFMKKLKAS